MTLGFAVANQQQQKKSTASLTIFHFSATFPYGPE